MEMYSEKDADILINYYSDKLIGQMFEESFDSRIVSIEKEYFGDNKYQVNVVGSMISEVIRPRRSIHLVVKDMGIELPSQVLNNFSSGKP